MSWKCRERPDLGHVHPRLFSQKAGTLPGPWLLGMLWRRLGATGPSHDVWPPWASGPVLLSPLTQPRPFGDPAWCLESRHLGQKLGLLSPSLTVTFPSTVFYPVTPPSRFLIERVQGIGLALGSLNTGTPQHVHSQLLPQDHPSLVPSFPQCRAPSEKPAPPSSGHSGFARLGGSEGAKEPGRGFAPVENNGRSKYTPG